MVFKCTRNVSWEKNCNEYGQIFVFYQLLHHEGNVFHLKQREINKILAFTISIMIRIECTITVQCPSLKKTRAECKQTWSGTTGKMSRIPFFWSEWCEWCIFHRRTRGEFFLIGLPEDLWWSIACFRKVKFYRSTCRCTPTTQEVEIDQSNLWWGVRLQDCLCMGKMNLKQECYIFLFL